MTLVILVCEDKTTNQSWQTYFAHKPVNLIALLAQEQQGTIPCRYGDDLKAACLKQLSQEFAGERIIFDNKDRGLGTGSGDHPGFLQMMPESPPNRINARLIEGTFLRDPPEGLPWCGWSRSCCPISPRQSPIRKQSFAFGLCGLDWGAFCPRQQRRDGLGR
jgi:hypothetical protein